MQPILQQRDALNQGKLTIFERCKIIYILSETEANRFVQISINVPAVRLI